MHNQASIFVKWLSSSDLSEIEDFIGLYETAFPLAEIEPVEQIREEIATKGDGHGFLCGSCYVGETFCGILRVHLFRTRKTALLVHIAVVPEFEGQGIGSQLLNQACQVAILNSCNHWLFAEMEPVILEDERRVRRYDWFQRNGFQVITKDYVQPSLREGCPEVPLWLLAKPLSENSDQIEPADIQAIMNDVYCNKA